VSNIKLGVPARCRAVLAVSTALTVARLLPTLPRSALPKACLLGLAVVFGHIPQVTAQVFNGWGPSYQYDQGWNPNVAVSAGLTVVEVHNGSGTAGPMWWKVGQISGNTIAWGPSYQYDSGWNPNVAVSGSTVVEVHNGSSVAGEMWYKVGQIQSNNTILWGHSWPYDWGWNPNVAVSGSTVVEVHNGGGAAGPLWYHVGQITGSTIAWGPSYEYASYGFNPSIGINSCLNNNNSSCGINIIEVHNGSGVAGPMWYDVGFLSSGSTIQWQKGIEYDWGWNPKVAFGDGAYLFEVHNGAGAAGPMWYHYGVFNGPTQQPTIQWSNSVQYDWGFNPSVAFSQGGIGAVEVHDGNGGAGPLWYHVASFVLLE
jgi:hypothetical protein